MGKVASPLGVCGVNESVEALVYCADSAFCLAIGLVMISGTHVEINFDISHDCIQKQEVNLGSLSQTIEVGKP